MTPAPTPALRAAVDNLATDRSTIRAFGELGRSQSPLASLYAALAAELLLSAARQQAMLHAHEAEERARIDAIDLELNGPTRGSRAT